MARRLVAVLLAILATAAPAAAQRLAGRDAPISIEIESLVGSGARASAGSAIVQDMRSYGDAWSGGAQLFWRAPAPVSARGEALPRLTLAIPLAAAGEHDLALAHTVAPDFGRFRVLLAGKPLVDVDGYHTGVEHREVSLGRHALAAGTVELVVVVTGKHEASTGAIVGLDRLLLRPVAGPAETGAGVTPPGGSGAPPGAGGAPAGATEAPAGASAAPARRSSKVRAASTAAGAPAAPLLVLAITQPKLEVHSDQLGFDPRGAHLYWTWPVLRPRFRWLPSNTGAFLARWELSEIPFPSDPRARPPKLLASGKSARAKDAETAEFEIELLPHKPLDKRIAPPGKPLPPFDPGVARPYLYVRVQALGEDGAPIGRPSNEVKLFFGKTGKLPKPKPGENRPRIRVVSYRPPRPYTFDFQCQGQALQDVVVLGTKIIAKGQKGNLCKKQSKDFFDDLSDAVGSVVDLVSSAVDWAATAYNDIKSSALSTVVDGLKASGVGCGGECQFAMGTALDAGLAAAGMPPSLPEFDQLVANLEQGGVDALAGQLAEAAKSQGVPDVVADEAGRRAAEELVKKAKEEANSGGGGGSKGVWRIDPAGLYSPVVVVLEATNLHPTRDSDPVYVALNGVFSGHAGLFRPSGTNLPALAPGRSLMFAFEPEPTVWEAGWMDFLPTPEDCPLGTPLKPAPWIQCYTTRREEAKTQLAEWTDLYVGHQHVFRIQTSIGPKTEKVADLVVSGSMVSWGVDFVAPAWQGKRVDLCLDLGKKCGEPAVQAFCQRMGYPHHLGFARADDIGPTRTLGDGKLCDAADCDGFAHIRCAPSP